MEDEMIIDPLSRAIALWPISDCMAEAPSMNVFDQCYHRSKFADIQRFLE
jgi:hypothetical protein